MPRKQLDELRRYFPRKNARERVYRHSGEFVGPLIKLGQPVKPPEISSKTSLSNKSDGAKVGLLSSKLCLSSRELGYQVRKPSIFSSQTTKQIATRGRPVLYKSSQIYRRKPYKSSDSSSSSSSTTTSSSDSDSSALNRLREEQLKASSCSVKVNPLRRTAELKRSLNTTKQQTKTPISRRPSPVVLFEVSSESSSDSSDADRVPMKARKTTCDQSTATELSMCDLVSLTLEFTQLKNIVTEQFVSRDSREEELRNKVAQLEELNLKLMNENEALRRKVKYFQTRKQDIECVVLD